MRGPAMSYRSPNMSPMLTKSPNSQNVYYVPKLCNRFHYWSKMHQ
uniref:Uncharacterized protein n=1 Tax=Setaria italica TaxID=4555 RepID=K3XUM8_SETIT